jgi:hypothetical protein
VRDAESRVVADVITPNHVPETPSGVLIEKYIQQRLVLCAMIIEARAEIDSRHADELQKDSTK